jgi:hypothetical protein
MPSAVRSLIVMSIRAALDELAVHLATPERRYDVSEFLPQCYAERLAHIMRLT